MTSAVAPVTEPHIVMLWISAIADINASISLHAYIPAGPCPCGPT